MKISEDCCECGDEEEFNLCAMCNKEDPSCLSPDHQLKEMQVAVPGDTYHPQQTGNALKVVAGPSTLSCTYCSENISQGWYYGMLCQKALRYLIDNV